MNCKLFISLFLASLLLGCSSGVQESGEGGTGGKGAGLSLAKSCSDLEEYIKSVVMLEQENMGVRKYMEGGIDAMPMNGDASQSSTETSGGAGEYSTTNVQEAGVDEADFVKNDGNYIYVLNRGDLFILKAWPPEEGVILSSTAIEGYATEMFLHEDKALVFSNVDFSAVKERFNLPDETTPENIVMGEFYPYYYWRPVTKVTVLDIADRTAPKIERETYLEANYLGSRMVTDTIHFVGYSHVYEPFYYNGCIEFAGGGVVGSGETVSGGDGGDTVIMTSPVPLPPGKLQDDSGGECISEAEYLKLLEKRLAKTDYIDFLPRYYDIVYDAEGEVKSQDTICSCNNFYKPEVIQGKDIVSIVSFNLKTGELNSTAILGQWGTLYASTDSLYLASYIFDYWVNALDGGRERFEEYSTIHKFDISTDPDRAEYQASGKVSGRIPNQFSMSEYQGFLRVATTRDQDWLTGEPPENNIFVLARKGDALEVAGSVSGIAPDERIYSARFIGERGYVVTFRQVDPMFTIDLSDPYNPKVAGELKVPGFSTYLHPMGEDHLLTIGRDATEEGRVKGLKLSVFDVSDLKNPSLLHETTLGQDWGTNSEATYNHKAFNYFAGKDLLAIPLSYYDWTDYTSEEKNFNGLIVFHVSTESGFKEIGKIDHQSLFTIDPQYWNCYYNTGVSRSIIMDDTIYSLSEWGIKANLFPELSEIKAISYPAPDPQDDYCVPIELMM